MNLGARLKEERERLGYNQTDFAALAGASKHAQINWEKGVAAPNAVALGAWAAAGLDVLYVVTGQHAGGGTSALPALAPDEAALLDNYRHSPKEQQDILKATSAAFAQPRSPKRSA